MLHDRGSGRYRLGPEAFAAGLAAEPSYQLQRLAAPGTAHPGGGVGRHRVLHRAAWRREHLPVARRKATTRCAGHVQKPGDRFPARRWAPAAAPCSPHWPDDDIADVLARSAALRAERYPRCTDDAIWRMVAGARERGYCVVPGLVLADSWAVGAVVFDTEGQPVASISLTAIKSRLGAAPVRSIGQPDDAGEQGDHGAGGEGGSRRRDRAGGGPLSSCHLLRGPRAIGRATPLMSSGPEIPALPLYFAASPTRRPRLCDRGLACIERARVRPMRRVHPDRYDRCMATRSRDPISALTQRGFDVQYLSPRQVHSDWRVRAAVGGARGRACGAVSADLRDHRLRRRGGRCSRGVCAMRWLSWDGGSTTSLCPRKSTASSESRPRTKLIT